MALASFGCYGAARGAHYDGNSPATTHFWPGNPYSYTTTLVRTYYNDIYLGPATGFILRLGQKFGLVTNWHVVSGRDATTGVCLSATAAIPNRIEFHVTVSMREGDDGKGYETRYFKELNLPLLDRDDTPLWLDSRESGPQEDVAVIPLNEHIEELARPHSDLCAIMGGKVTLKRGVEYSKEVMRADDITHFYPMIGSEVFMLGYPLGITTFGIFPIWKRGSIASEPQVGIELGGRGYKTAFYIDALTKRGMSGSPVICVGLEGDYMYTEDGMPVQLRKSEPLLIGVYAGRDGVTQDEHEMSLGRVWKAGLIESILMKSVRI